MSYVVAGGVKEDDLLAKELNLYIKIHEWGDTEGKHLLTPEHNTK